MELNLDREKTLDRDVWNMEATVEDELIFAKQGSKPTPISEVLSAVKQWMETKKKELCQTSQNATTQIVR